MKWFRKYKENIFTAMIIIIGIAGMIFLVADVIFDRLDANRTCSEINSESYSPIIHIKEKRFVVCGSNEPILREIK